MNQPIAKHILVADDSEGAAELLAEVLSLSVAQPITTAIAHNGAEAVAAAASRPPSVAFLDLEMPVMNGIQAAKAIRTAFSGAPPLLVAVTGNMFWAQQRRAQDVFDHVFSKPADIGLLVKLIDNA